METAGWSMFPLYVVHTRKSWQHPSYNMISFALLNIQVSSSYKHTQKTSQE